MGISKIVVFGLLWSGFFLLFYRIRLLQNLVRLWQQTEWELEEASRQRGLTNRRNLILMEQDNTWWFRLEKALIYGGFVRRIPFLTAERFVAGNIVGIAGVGVVVCACTGKLWAMAAAALGIVLAEYLLIVFARNKEWKRVNNSLLKLLDFLGNYSLTAGEITGILEQVSRYMEEPLRTVLTECSYEAQITGDVSLALSAMAEKIEHPMFKEMVRNMEVSVRYCADFTRMVQNSRRSVREYLRAREERNGMLREALVSMLLLTGMSFLALAIANELIDTSIWKLLRDSVPGKVAMGIIAGVYVLFFRKVSTMTT